MKTIKNISPLGALAIPSLRLEIPADGRVELTNEVADLLLAQPDNFVEVKKATKPPSRPRKPAAASVPKKPTVAFASVPSAPAEEI